MLSLQRIDAALMIAAGLALMVAPPLGAQTGADRDAREISSYQLTDAGLAKYSQATRNLAPLTKGVSGNCAKDGESDDGGDAKTLDQSVAKLDGIAGIRAAIQSAGMTTREYVVFTWSIFQTGMAAWALDQPGGKLPADVAMENVTFYRQHEAALRKLGEDTKPADCGEDEQDSVEQEPQ
jgi:hypothetical protein